MHGLPLACLSLPLSLHALQLHLWLGVPSGGLSGIERGGPDTLSAYLTLFCFDFLGLSLVDKGKQPRWPRSSLPAALGTLADPTSA